MSELQVAPRDAREEKPEPLIVHKTLVYHLCSLAALTYCKLWHRLRVEGLENLPEHGGVVIASNHQSFLDILAFGGCMPRHTAFVARSTLAEAGWLDYVMRQCGTVLVRRGASDRKALRGMADHLEAGDCVVIFPEGTRSRDGRLGEFKGGALLAARIAKVPIVPVGIRGAFAAWPRGVTIPRPRKVVMRFGAPIDSALPDAQERLIQAVQAMVGDGSVR